MNDFLKPLAVFLLCSTTAVGQLLPKEGSKLNYRLVGFRWANEHKQPAMTIEIAKGHYYSIDSFKKQVIKRIRTDNNKILIELAEFGTSYTWCLAADGEIKDEQVALHHFSIGKTWGVDTSKTRLRIIQKAEKYTDYFVFLDGQKALYNMNGEPIWYLPFNKKNAENGAITDLKLTQRKTITYLYNDQRAIEKDCNGNVLWRGAFNDVASRDTHYHHEFTRLDNGHYMVLGTEAIEWRPAGKTAQNGALYQLREKTGNDPIQPLATFPFGVLYEYDNQRNMVWRWRFLDYFQKSDLYNRKPAHLRFSFDAHVNAFYFDQIKKVIYLGFRNINRILKIAYPSGKVLATYGTTFKDGKYDPNTQLFTGQHSIKINSNGQLYIYNNNVDIAGGLPSLLVCEESNENNATLNKIWEYTCKVSDLGLPPTNTVGYTRGGNVVEMTGGSYFVSMSSPYCKLFIVAPNKNELWSAVPESWDNSQKKWDVIQTYRASIISRAHLEQMIWGEESNR